MDVLSKGADMHPNTEEQMTKAERVDLAKLARQRERVAKAEAVYRAAELRADFEKHLAAIYSFDDDEVWRAAVAAANEEVAKAQDTIARRCNELGIPKGFAPSLNVGWYGRGQNAAASRRVELRNVAHSRIEAMEKNAKLAISRQSVEVQTQLVQAGLTTAEAQRFLDAMPSAAKLMPALDAGEVERAALELRRGEED